MAKDNRPLRRNLKLCCKDTSDNQVGNLDNLKILPSGLVIPRKTKSEEILQANTHKISPALLELYDRLLEGKISKVRLAKKLSPESPVSESEKWLNLEHHTKIILLNKFGDAEVRVKFSSANLSLSKQISRSHFFWWERPQEDLRFSAVDSSGGDLLVHVVRSTPHFNEIKVLFSEPLAPFERVDYEIQYKVTKAFLDHQFYFLRPHTATNLLSLTVAERVDTIISKANITIETSDGYIKDIIPKIDIKELDQRQTLSWQIKYPAFGDFFKTYWTPSARVPLFSTELGSR